MKFTVEKQKLLQGRAYLRKSLFQNYILTEESLEFSLNLSVFLQCLLIFGEDCHMEISYVGHGHPISLTYGVHRIIHSVFRHLTNHMRYLFLP